MSNIQKLLDIASKPFTKVKKIHIESKKNQERINELKKILQQKNGFFVFEQALCFFPSEKSKESYSLAEWNNQSYWKNKYEDKVNLFFFAEDIFGNKFCFQKNKVCFFDIETGEIEIISDTVEQWAREILKDYNYRTGYSLSHQWQEKNGALANKKRLQAITPFILGGEYKIENLSQMDSFSVVEKASEVEKKTREHKDGSSIELAP